MPRTPYTSAPETIRSRIEDHLRAGDIYGAVLAAVERGYDFPPELVPQAATKQVADAWQTDRGRAGALKVELADQLAIEERAMALSVARRHWAETTSLDDDARRDAVLAAERRERQRSAFAADRARQILSERATADRAEADRLARAEFDAAHPAHVAPPTKNPKRAMSASK